MLMASCADDFDRSYSVDRPANLAAYEYLNDYQSLKTYVDRSKYPNFKLGVGTTVSDYVQKELVYVISSTNFDEVVAGNAMKMGSVVGEFGDMDFSNVIAFVNTAADAGQSVYGHTLAWHAQQPTKWLNRLMKDKELDVDPNEKIETLVNEKTYTDGPFPFYAMGCEPPVINGSIHFEPTGDWSQFFIFPGGENSLAEGDYRVYLDITSSDAAEGVQLTMQNGWGGSDQNVTVNVPVEAGQHVYELNFPGMLGGNYDAILKPQTAMATLDVTSIKVYKLDSPAVEVEQEVRTKTYDDGPFPFYAMGCEPPVINGGLHFVPTGDWSQFFVFPGGENSLTEGDYLFYVDIQSDKDASGIQLTIQNGWGGSDQNMTANIPVVAGRHTYKLNFPGVLGGNYDVILKPQSADAVLDVYSVAVSQLVKLNSIPMTDEEKKDTLIWAMDKWISGMMEACDGQVKAWDVVNEAISGADTDGDGFYDLQHASNDENDFFWQNYLGDIDYVRTAVRLARQYGPQDVKLFINDYNLESDWDNNQKLKSLIEWIKRWEADGVTKIDGIGSQMHISCYMDPAMQESKKNAIESMLRLMAGTGKLVRISELDMGLVGADGKDVQTADATEEQLKAMSDLYKFVVSKYLEIVPAAQQWGICQWAATDSPAGSGWRPNSPLGLWDLNYNRKHAYAGFADGLQGK